jgi:hypothetical protein
VLRSSCHCISWRDPLVGISRQSFIFYHRLSFEALLFPLSQVSSPNCAETVKSALFVYLHNTCYRRFLRNALLTTRRGLLRTCFLLLRRSAAQTVLKPSGQRALHVSPRSSSCETSQKALLTTRHGLLRPCFLLLRRSAARTVPRLWSQRTRISLRGPSSTTTAAWGTRS